MNLDIERVAITLQGASSALGERIADGLDRSLRRHLSALRLRTAGSGVAQLDLGVIDAPPGADAQLVTELIAGRLAEWIANQQGDATTDAAPSGEGR